MAPAVGQREANRPWSPDEFDVVWSHVSVRKRRALALPHHAGPAHRRHRARAVVGIGWRGADGSPEQYRRRGAHSGPGAPPHRTHLGEAEGTQVVVTGSGEPYTRDGRRTNLWRLANGLEAKTLAEPGLCFHDFRHDGQVIEKKSCPGAESNRRHRDFQMQIFIRIFNYLARDEPAKHPSPSWRTQNLIEGTRNSRLRRRSPCR